ncbi:hypothetical protein H4S07_004386, partial [Coemansia furcata]
AAEVEGATSTPPPPVTTIFGTPAPKLATKTAEVLPPKAPEAAAVPAARQGPSATTAALATSELRLPVFSFTLPAATAAVSSAAAKLKVEKLNVSQLPIFAFTLDIKTAAARGFSQLPSKPMQPSAQAKTGEWTCDVCELKSPLSAAQCIVCDAVRPVVKPDVAPSAPPAASSWISSEFRPVAPKDGEWVCDTCELKNPLAASKCTVCDAAKPEPKPAASSTAPVPNIWAQGGFNVAGPKDGEWVCDTCELKNPPAAPKCTICDAAKPGAPNTVPAPAAASAAPVPNIWAQSGFNVAGPKDGEWVCDTCELKNPLAAPKCTICDAAKPGAPNAAPAPAASSAAPVPNIWAQSGFNFAGPKDGEWICDTCELKNPPTASKCTVCDAAKPAKTSGAPPTSSLTPLAKKKASDLDASQLPVFSFDLDVSKKPAFPSYRSMGSSNSTQAWLFAMTSGLASSLGAAAIYLDPVLHALGMPSNINLLESHTALSAMLSGASGIMAYTSISTLTKESTDYLSRIPEWPLLGRYPGAVTAALFIVGAHLNLLLVRLVSRITPSDSPIKHACASHPPSPSGSQLERGTGYDAHSKHHRLTTKRSSDVDSGPS